MTVALSPIEAGIAAVASEIRKNALARKPGDATAKAQIPSPPPLWIDPEDNVPAPGTKQGTEDDTATVLGLVFAGEITPRPYETGIIKFTVDVWYRCKGDRPARRAVRIHNDIRELLRDRRGELIAVGTDEQLRIVSIDQFRGIQKLEATIANGHSYIASWVVEVYARPSG